MSYGKWSVKANKQAYTRTGSMNSH